MRGALSTRLQLAKESLVKSPKESDIRNLKWSFFIFPSHLKWLILLWLSIAIPFDWVKLTHRNQTGELHLTGRWRQGPAFNFEVNLKLLTCKWSRSVFGRRRRRRFWTILVLAESPRVIGHLKFGSQTDWFICKDSLTRRLVWVSQTLRRSVSLNDV